VSKTLQSIVPRTLAVDLADIVRARDLSIIYPTVSARDLVHAAVMLNHGITTVVSVDRHFDSIHEIVRLSPETFVTEMSQQRDQSTKPSPDASE
jgi:predicted nucleic acid-binding protein